MSDAVPGGSPASNSSPPRDRGHAALLMVMAGIMLVLGPFLPWESFGSVGTVNLDTAFRLTGEPYLTWIALAPGFAAIAIGALARRHLRAAAIVVAALAAYVDGGLAVGSFVKLDHSRGLNGAGVGAAVELLGAVVLVLAAIAAGSGRERRSASPRGHRWRP
ncbi:MAG: hypothetical protein ACYCST_07110 [Acidimicrobiales bacterium]